MSPEELFDTALNGDPLDALTAIVELRDLLDDTEHAHVLTLRRHGASWAHIARQLGVTRQAINQKHAHWDPPKP